MRKIIAVLVLMAVGFGSVFALDNAFVSTGKGIEYTSSAEIIEKNVPNLVSDWLELGWEITSINIDFILELQLSNGFSAPENVKAALKDGYGYAHDHSEEILVSFQEEGINQIFVKRVMAYKLKDAKVLMITVYASYYEKIE